MANEDKTDADTKSDSESTKPASAPTPRGNVHSKPGQPAQHEAPPPLAH